MRLCRGFRRSAHACPTFCAHSDICSRDTICRFTASLTERTLSEDPSTAVRDDLLPPYNAYSVDGDVTADLVFVNYATPEDFEMLARYGISVEGKIVIARYGRTFRGIKPKVAAEHGAIGATGARPRPIDVEQAQRNRGQAVNLVPVHDVLFGDVFGQCVGVHRARRRRLRRWGVVRDAVAR